MGRRVKRPVVWITGAYVLGILAEMLISLGSLILWGGAAFLLCLLFYYIQKGKNGFPLLLLLFLLFGMLDTGMEWNTANPMEALNQKEVTIRGIIVEPPQIQAEKISFVADASEFTLQDKAGQVSGKIAVTVYISETENLVLSQGDIVLIKGRMEEPSGPRNPGAFDYRGYLKRRDISMLMKVYPGNVQVNAGGSMTIGKSILYQLRSWSEQALTRYVGGQAGDLMKGMLLGERWVLPEDLLKEFSSTGLAHILAISGLHVGFIIIVLVAAARALHLPSWWAFFLQTAGLVIYCLLVGAAPSVVRASIMAVVYLGGSTLGRRSDAVNSLSLAALIILLIRPLDLFEVGFQLSFGAVGGIALFYTPIRKAISFFPRFVASAFALTISSQLMIWPMVAYYFNYISPVSFIANLLLVPLAGLLVLTGCLILFTAAVFPGLAVWIGYVIQILSVILTAGNRYLSQIPYASIRIVRPSWFFMGCYYTSLLAMYAGREKPGQRTWKWAALVAAAYMIGIMLYPIWVPQPLKVIFVDVGQGDCIYIRTPDHKNILVDAGGRSGQGQGSFDVGEDIVVPFLLQNGVNYLDLVIMSHAHDDHLGGLLPVIRDLPVKNFLGPVPAGDTQGYQELRTLLLERKVHSMNGLAGQTYRVGEEIQIDVLYPFSNYTSTAGSEDENRHSMVFLLTYQDTSILFTGDIGAGEEDELRSKWDLKADILKVAHHGSITSTSERWLDQLHPMMGIIQVGKNLFGHPAPEILERFQKRRIPLYRNDQQGAVICTYQDGKWEVSTCINDKE